MAAIPLWMLGRHITAVQAVLQTVDPTTGVLANAGNNTTTNWADLTLSTGTVAAGNVVFSQGLVDSIEMSGAKTVEEISAVTDVIENYVPIALRDGITITEILRIGAATCLLANLWAGGNGATNASRIVKLTFARGDQRFIGYFLMVSYSESIRRGKSTAQMQLDMVDPGQANFGVTLGQAR